jgi:hypothetical protein
MKAALRTVLRAALVAALGLMALYLIGCGGVGTGPSDLSGDEVTAQQATATVQGRVVDARTLGQPGGPTAVNKVTVRLQPVLGGRSKSGRTSRFRQGYYRINRVRLGDYYVFVTPPFGYGPASDPDGDPSNGIATITVFGGGRMTLPDIAINVPQDGPPPPPF